MIVLGKNQQYRHPAGGALDFTEDEPELAKDGFRNGRGKLKGSGDASKDIVAYVGRKNGKGTVGLFCMQKTARLGGFMKPGGEGRILPQDFGIGLQHIRGERRRIRQGMAFGEKDCELVSAQNFNGKFLLPD